MSRFLAILCGFWVLSVVPVSAQEDGCRQVPRLLSVGSGYDNGVYFWLATMLGGIVAHPQAGLSCGHGGNCGVERLQLMTVATEGSLDNLAMLRQQKLDSAFVQSNAAYQSYTASGAYAQQPPFADLRVLASLYAESLQLVVHADSDIRHVADLLGKRVAVGAKGSGTYLMVRDFLAAHHLDESQFVANVQDAETVAKLFLDHQLDAVFYVAGVPTPQVESLSQKTAVRLLPTRDDDTENHLLTHHYYTVSRIPSGTYQGQVEDVPVLNVQALWVVNQRLVDDALAYQLTHALWTYPHAAILQKILPRDALSIAHSLDGIGIPLHTGAKRFYDEIGKRF